MSSRPCRFSKLPRLARCYPAGCLFFLFSCSGFLFAWVTNEPPCLRLSSTKLGRDGARGGQFWTWWRIVAGRAEHFRGARAFRWASVENCARPCVGGKAVGSGLSILSRSLSGGRRNTVIYQSDCAPETSGHVKRAGENHLVTRPHFHPHNPQPAAQGCRGSEKATARALYSCAYRRCRTKVDLRSVCHPPSSLSVSSSVSQSDSQSGFF